MTSAPKGRAKIPPIPGTKPSIQNAQLLISTGIPSLDDIIGGGLPIGSILLIEEDTYGSYAEIMLKYFLAEGAVVSHSLLVASQDVKPDELISGMPAVVTEAPAPPPSHLDEKMQIAWRYQNMKIIDSSPKSSQIYGHFYDLTKRIDPDIVEKIDITKWDGEAVEYFEGCGFKNYAYVDLLKTVQQTLKEKKFYVTANPEKRNILRIGLHSLGSRLWLCDTQDATHADFLKFLYYFRALLRSSFAVAVITVPSNNFGNHNHVMGRMEHLADTVISLESFASSFKETNAVFKDYHGLLRVKKLSAINTLAAHCPESFDLAFKLRRKKFVIEILHLPPALGDSTEREQDEAATATGCGSGVKNLLEF